MHAWFSTLGPDRRYIILFNVEKVTEKGEENRMLSGTSTIIGFPPDPDVWYLVQEQLGVCLVYLKVLI